MKEIKTNKKTVYELEWSNKDYTEWIEYSEKILGRLAQEVETTEDKIRKNITLI